jgi:hypothetical protein
MSNPSYDPRLIPFTGQHEGKVLRAYRCPAGVITIGFGFTWGSKIFRDWWLTNKGSQAEAWRHDRGGGCLLLLKALIDNEYSLPVAKRGPNATPHAKAAAIDMLSTAAGGHEVDLVQGTGSGRRQGCGAAPEDDGDHRQGPPAAGACPPARGSLDHHGVQQLARLGKAPGPARRRRSRP